MILAPLLVLAPHLLAAVRLLAGLFLRVMLCRSRKRQSERLVAYFESRDSLFHLRINVPQRNVTVPDPADKSTPI